MKLGANIAKAVALVASPRLPWPPPCISAKSRCCWKRLEVAQRYRQEPCWDLYVQHLVPLPCPSHFFLSDRNKLGPRQFVSDKTVSLSLVFALHSLTLYESSSSWGQCSSESADFKTENLSKALQSIDTSALLAQAVPPLQPARAGETLEHQCKLCDLSVLCLFICNNTPLEVPASGKLYMCNVRGSQGAFLERQACKKWMVGNIVSVLYVEIWEELKLSDMCTVTMSASGRARRTLFFISYCLII